MRKLSCFAFSIPIWLCSPANATTFYWDYFGSGIIAAGTFEATDPNNDGLYDVASITGTRNGVAIDGLSDYALSDNIIIPAGSPDQLTFNGLAFSVGSNAYNVFYQFSSDNDWTCGIPNSYCELTRNGGIDGVGDPSFPVTFRVSETPLTATPLPAALPLYATGLGVIGFLAWRRKRKRAAAMAT